MGNMTQELLRSVASRLYKLDDKDRSLLGYKLQNLSSILVNHKPLQGSLSVTEEFVIYEELKEVYTVLEKYPEAVL